MIFDNGILSIYGQKLYVGAEVDMWAPKMQIKDINLETKSGIFEACVQPFNFDRELSKISVTIGKSMINSVIISVPEYTSYRVGNSFFVLPTIQKTVQLLEDTKTEEDGPTKQAVLPHITLNDEYNKIINKIGTFKTLKFNWDSYGALPIKKDCIERAINFILEAIEWMQSTGLDIPAPFVVPTSKGGIQFEWKKLSKYLEIELIPDNPDLIFFAADESIEGEFELEGVLKYGLEIKDILSWLASGAVGSLKMLFAKKAI
jgi:hypothetical protein